MKVLFTTTQKCYNKFYHYPGGTNNIKVLFTTIQ